MWDDLMGSRGSHGEGRTRGSRRFTFDGLLLLPKGSFGCRDCPSVARRRVHNLLGAHSEQKQHEQLGGELTAEMELARRRSAVSAAEMNEPLRRQMMPKRVHGFRK